MKISEVREGAISFCEKHRACFIFLYLLAFPLLVFILILALQASKDFGMVDVYEINQSFVAYVAQADLSDEQKSQMLAVYSDALSDELERIGERVILFSSNQVVTPLEDYTRQVKVAISDALLDANKTHKLP